MGWPDWGYLRQRNINKPRYFTCACGDPEHTLIFSYYEDPEYPEVYASVFLDDGGGVFKRLWTALKYLCGYRSPYGEWHCFTMRDDDVDNLIKLLQKYRIDMEEAKNGDGA